MGPGVPQDPFAPRRGPLGPSPDKGGALVDLAFAPTLVLSGGTLQAMVRGAYE